MNSGMGILPGDGHQVRNTIRMMRKQSLELGSARLESHFNWQGLLLTSSCATTGRLPRNCNGKSLNATTSAT